MGKVDFLLSGIERVLLVNGRLHEYPHGCPFILLIAYRR
jgi:hypothetical protein